MKTDRVIYELSCIKQAHLHLPPAERAKGSIGELIARYNSAVETLDEPILRRVYDLLYIKGMSTIVCALTLNCDRKSLYRYNLRLVTCLNEVLHA